MIRAFVPDDEELAVRRLSRMLAETGQVEIVGAATDSVSAVGELKRTAPDVLFLDINMPGLNGFAFLNEVGPEQPLIVFTTAYQEYALKAFEVNSVDYLLKPVAPHQLERALAKVQRMLGGSEPRADVNALLRRLSSALEAKRPDYPARLPSRTGDRVEFVDLARVTHFYAKDKLTFAATGGKDYWVDGGIVELEARLDPKRFLRIHRSTMVNIDYVHELYAWFSVRVLIRLRNDKRTELTVSRDRVKALKEKLDL